MGLLSAVYLAGLAAVSLPLLFHLIRPTPRGKQTFSSLMFLTPSPPRVTRRSRLDHLLLLLLRAAALCLLALAFARPFLRESVLLPLAEVPRRRVAIVLDTSASMQRGDLWKRAVAKAGEVLDDLGPTDDVALFVFNDRLQTVIDFAESSTAPAAKLDLVRRELAELTPSWRATDLGAALTVVANELDASGNDETAATEPHLVLISDLQQGSRTDALQPFSWPERVPVVVHALAVEQPTNASVHLLADEAELESAEPRVRVANAADSVGEEFYVQWATSEKPAIDDTMVPVYVPPGQSRVVRLPRPKSAPTADRIVLRGDVAEFDNVHYVVAPRQQEVAIAYFGDEQADDPQRSRYYFERAIADTPLRKVDVRASRTGEPLSLAGENAPKLTVLTEAVSTPMREALESYIKSGGMLLVVLKDRPMAESLAFLFEGLEAGDEPESGEYQLFGEIDFSHPLFVPFASPRYSDFTKIHFWKRRRLAIRPGAATRVIARFDNQEPAIIERTLGVGRALLFASGWQPSDSQLALSTKFVPLMQEILDLACGKQDSLASATVGRTISLPQQARSQPIAVINPQGESVELAATTETFDQTDRPGIYHLRSGDMDLPFAVNVDVAESNTAPLEMAQLEQLGVRLAKDLSRSERAREQRQQRDLELENRQKIWRWLIVAAVAVLIFETWLAGWTARRIRQTTEALA